MKQFHELVSPKSKKVHVVSNSETENSDLLNLQVCHPRYIQRVLKKQMYDLLCKESKYRQDFDYVILSSSVKERST